MRFAMATSRTYVGFLRAIILTLFLSLQVNAQSYTENLQQRIGIDQKLGDQLPLDLPFVDSDGNPVHLRDYFGDKPVILSLVYFDCPMLCTQVINSLLRAMNVLSFGAGTEFDVLTISIDPGETPELANAKKIEYLKNYRGREGSTGWHFLTGDQQQIDQLAAAVGFASAVDYIQSIGLDVMQSNVNNLTEKCLETLLRINDLKIHGPIDPLERTGIISFNLKNVHSHDVAQIAGERNVAVRAGHHCCQPLMKRLNETATVRASFAPYNINEDIDALVEAILITKSIFARK